MDALLLQLYISSDDINLRRQVPKDKAHISLEIRDAIIHTNTNAYVLLHASAMHDSSHTYFFSRITFKAACTY